MTIGTLRATICLDSGSKVHYGSNEPITGQVALKYIPYASKSRPDGMRAELFGPLTIVLQFHGRAKTKIVVHTNTGNGSSTSIYRGRTPLLWQSVKVYDGPFKAQPGGSCTFPFELRFPETTTQQQVPAQAWNAHPRPVSQPGTPLPPSFFVQHRNRGRHFNAFVEYRLGVQIAMPGLDIELLVPGEEAQPFLLYDRPRLRTPVTGPPMRWTGSMSVRNEFLLPEADRPTGFRQKMKATFSHDYYPEYVFDWICTGSRHLHLDQPVAWEVVVKPHKRSTATVIPDIVLSGFYIRFRQSVVARAERWLGGNKEQNGNDDILALQGLADRAPFSQANTWTKVVTTRPLVHGSVGTGSVPAIGFVTNFNTEYISLSHGVQLRLEFTVAGKIKSHETNYAVEILPPLADEEPSIGSPSNGVAAGPSTQPLNMENLAEALPAYPRLPEYDEAVEGAPAPPRTDEKSAVIQESLR